MLMLLRIHRLHPRGRNHSTASEVLIIPCSVGGEIFKKGFWKVKLPSDKTLINSNRQTIYFIHSCCIMLACTVVCNELFQCIYTQLLDWHVNVQWEIIFCFFLRTDKAITLLFLSGMHRWIAHQFNSDFPMRFLSPHFPSLLKAWFEKRSFGVSREATGEQIPVDTQKKNSFKRACNTTMNCEGEEKFND